MLALELCVLILLIVKLLFVGLIFVCFALLVCILFAVFVYLWFRRSDLVFVLWFVGVCFVYRFSVWEGAPFFLGKASHAAKGR